MRCQMCLAFMMIALFPLSGFGQNVEVDVGLSPAGSFKAKTKKVDGVAVKNGDSVTANDITVDLTTLSSGIALRDKHLKERLMVSKYPLARLTNGTGKNGKGIATLEIKGKKQKINGTYKITGKKLQAQFKVQLPALGINDVRYMGVGVKDAVTVNVIVPVTESAASKPKKKKAATEEEDY